MKLLKKIILIVGKSRSGKDTIAKILEKDFQVKPIVSYTTRPKRDNETNGVEHWFISEKEMERIKNEEDMIGYTKNESTGIEYCAVSSDLDPKMWYSYIINPEGIRYFMANMKPDVYFHIVYVDCPEDILMKRGKERNDQDTFLRRLESEREEFDYFKHHNSSLINTIIDTNSYNQKLQDMVVEMLFNNINTVYALDMSQYDYKKHDSVQFTEHNGVVYLKNLNGRPTMDKCTIEKIITPPGGKMMDKYFVLDKYPNTIVTASDISYKLNGISEWFQYLKYKIISRKKGN